MRPRRRRKAASVSSGSEPDARPVRWSVHTISHRVHGPACAHDAAAQHGAVALVGF